MRDAVFSAQGLTKAYKGSAVLDGVSFALERGKVYGLAGLKGSGKTTVLKLMAGIAAKDSGELRFFGEEPPASVEARGKVGYMIDGPVFSETMNVRKNLEMVRLLKKVGNRERVGELMDMLELSGEGNTDQLVFRQQLGVRQKLGIAAALMSDPELVLLDDAAGGIDPAYKSAFGSLLVKLTSENSQGRPSKTVLITGSRLTDMIGYCDELFFLDKGKIAAHETRKSILDRCDIRYSINTVSSEAAEQTLKKLFSPGEYQITSEESFDILSPRVTEAELRRMLEINGVLVKSMQKQGISIEEFYHGIVDAGIVGGGENA
ncbi:MAG: ABC transporter ATP-binding protein [Oscillospiraceae bacterium]|jgi:ABC-2 type transport system ATP-binding protein|nr:ABC transporter ATP-binding protein [Oscillospiraceae bacterium]